MMGSIPARAGEPSFPRVASPWLRVYPRACGGTSSWQAQHSGSTGLSPRVRGNLIVASAQGNPGAGEVLARPVTTEGLSPRVRGNRGMSPP